MEHPQEQDGLLGAGRPAGRGSANQCSHGGIVPRAVPDQRGWVIRQRAISGQKDWLCLNSYACFENDHTPPSSFPWMVMSAWKTKF